MRVVALVLSAFVAIIAGILVALSAPHPADATAAAKSVASAYSSASASQKATNAEKALPKDAQGRIAVAGGSSSNLASLSRLAVGSTPSTDDLVRLGAIGPVGVATVGDVTAYVAVPVDGPGLAAVLAVLFALASAAVATVGFRRAGNRSAVTVPAVPVAAVPVAAPAPGPAIAGRPDPRSERESLVASLASLADQLPPGLQEQAVSALAQVGVTSQSVDGQPFDASWQVAVGSEPAPSPAQVRLIARTQRPYFADRGKPVTQPLVVVYTAAEPGTPA